MQVLALVNQKGGCGKTTTAVHLAAALARSHTWPERVLLVDLDPQAHATLALGHCAEGELSTVDVLIEGAPIHTASIRATGGFRLLPATSELAEFEEIAERRLHPEQFLRTALRQEDFDYVVLDCPPRADGVLTSNALTACDTAVLVVEAGAFALQGALRAQEMMAERRSVGGFDFGLRALATLVDPRSRLAEEILAALRHRFGSALFRTAIHTSQPLREAAARGVPVQSFAPDCRAAAEFQALAEEVREYAGRTQEMPSTPSAPSPARPASGDLPQVSTSRTP